ncbi:hypothetical protein J6590_021194 [Homalodisca vitripennis]|nr:hypothetical protein J6590_021194 [Homalodisca vitripennis]
MGQEICVGGPAGHLMGGQGRGVSFSTALAFPLESIKCDAKQYLQVAVVPPTVQGGVRKKSSPHQRARRMYEHSAPPEVKVEPPTRPTPSSTSISYNASRPGVSQAEDGPLAPDLQLDWLSSTESDDDSGIEVLSVQYNNSNNTNNSSSTSGRPVQVVDLTQESDEEMLYQPTPPPPRQPPQPPIGPPPLIRLRLPSCRYQPPPPVSPPDQPPPTQSTLNFNSYIPATCIHAPAPPPATWLPPVPHAFTPAPPIEPPTHGMPHGAGFPGYFPSTPPRLYPVHQQLWQSQQRMQELQRRRLAPPIPGSVLTLCRYEYFYG